MVKIMDKENDENESGIYVVCGGRRSATEPTFVNTTYPPVLLISNVEPTITTDNVPREISIKNQKYSLFGTTSHKSRHFIGMVVCNDHQHDTVVDDCFRTTEGVHAISAAFYTKSK